MTLQRLQANQAWDKIAENVLNSWVRQLELISSSVSSGDSRIAALSSSVSVINATAAFLAQANTFTAAQTVQVATAGTAFTIQSTEAGAGAGPDFVLDRNSASPAPSDILGNVYFRGRNSVGSSINYARILPLILDHSNGSEDGAAQLRSMQAGADTLQMTWGNGVTIGNPTGGSQGVGTLNVDNAIYKDGTQVVSDRITGWGDPFGAVSRATFSTTTATANQVAQALAALIIDLKAHGLIGT